VVVVGAGVLVVTGRDAAVVDAEGSAVSMVDMVSASELQAARAKTDATARRRMTFRGNRVTMS
jgi:hypothetical protein